MSGGIEERRSADPPGNASLVTGPDAGAPGFFAAVRDRVLAGESRPEIGAAARDLVAAGGGEVVGVVFFGSRRTSAERADPWSAHDFFVLVRSYREAYAALRRSGKTGKSPWLMAVLNAFLPPNQISLRLGDPAIHAKCSVISLAAFVRETSAHRRDHFCIGRLFQPSQVLSAADPETSRSIVAALVSAHAETYGWVRPWLPDRFDAEAYCRTALRVSLGREIRPEPEDARRRSGPRSVRSRPRCTHASSRISARARSCVRPARPPGRWHGR